MLTRRTTLAQFLIEEQRRHEGSTGGFNSLVLDVALACKSISQRVSRGTLDVDPNDPTDDGEGSEGGERPATGHRLGNAFQATANEVFLRATEWDGNLAGTVSEQMDAPRPVPDNYSSGNYLLVFNALDGAANLDVGATVGSIFSILRTPRPGETVRDEDFLQAGTEQVAAGYAIYGPATMLVITVGRGVQGFTLDTTIGEFILTHPDMRIPGGASEFAINHSARRFWEPAVRRYVDECLAGETGPRERDFEMRWVASLVAEAHHILIQGGVFLYPRDEEDSDRFGHLRLLYEANPIAFLIEQAGGWASTGRGRVLDIEATSIHQGIPFLFGERSEIELIEDYHADLYDVGGSPTEMPLYAARGLFRIY